MADELPTADRDALRELALEGFHRWDCFEDDHSECAVGAGKVVDALLPHLAVLLDRARQQGRDDKVASLQLVTKEANAFDVEAAYRRGREDAAQAIEASDGIVEWYSPQPCAPPDEDGLMDLCGEQWRSCPGHRQHMMRNLGRDDFAALARGSQTAPSATENAETGGGA